MKKISIVFLTLIIIFSACKSLEDPGIEFKCEDNPIVCELAESNNNYGWEIFKKLHEAAPEDNLFISPTSISTAFGMLLNGARTETQTEILEVMHLNGWKEAELNDAFKALLEILPALDPKVKMDLANSIWYRDGFQVLDDFLAENEEHFQSEVRSMDFDDPETKEIINGWIEDQTNGKIKDMIDQISPQTVMFLVNAIYFYGQWQFEFDKKDTEEGFFYPDGKTPVQTEMMSMGEVSLPYYSDSDLTMLDLPYGDSIFSMTILLPNGNRSVDDLFDLLDAGSLDDRFGSMNTVELSSVILPKFKIEYKNSLVTTLKALGMEKVFDPFEADLSGINGTGDLFVSDVIHQSFIEVDEKGTEAAAATVIVIDFNAAGYSFIANRSFIFMIRDRSTGSIQFTGKMMSP